MKKKVFFATVLVFIIALCSIGLFACASPCEHEYVYGECKNCGAIDESYMTKGITFELVGNTHYKVTGYTGNSDEVIIPDVYRGKPVTVIEEYAFDGKSSLTSVIVPNNVSSIGNFAFGGCKGLTEITVPFVGSEKSGSGNTNFGCIFGKSTFGTTEYNNMNVPKALKTVNITGGSTIASNAFFGCDKIIDVNIPSTVTSIGNNVFTDCSSLTNINVDSHNAVYSSIDGNLYSKDGKTLILYACGKAQTSFTTPSGLKTVKSSAFLESDNLETVTITDSVEEMGVNVFERCDKLKTVSIGNGIKTLKSYTFKECASLTNVTLGSSIESIEDYAFFKCEELKVLTFPSSVKSIGFYVFIHCNKLENVEFIDTENWYNTNDKTKWEKNSGGKLVDVTSKSNNANNFLNDFKNYYWYKKVQ